MKETTDVEDIESLTETDIDGITVKLGEYYTQKEGGAEREITSIIRMDGEVFIVAVWENFEHFLGAAEFWDEFEKREDNKTDRQDNNAEFIIKNMEQLDDRALYFHEKHFWQLQAEQQDMEVEYLQERFEEEKEFES